MSVEDEAARRCARTLWECWQEGRKIDGVADADRPRSLAEGYAVQAALCDVAQDRIAGWKIAATSKAGQSHIGVDGPIAGRLLAGRLKRSPATVALGSNLMRVAEAEFVFGLGEDLPPRDAPYSVHEVMNAVASLTPAIELPDSRYRNFAAAGAPLLIAECACADCLVLGDEADEDWRRVDLRTHRVAVRVDGVERARGTGADVLGDPRLALTWIANNHRAHGDFLRAGQIVTTGVCGRPVSLSEGASVEADFGSFGRVEVIAAL